MNKKAMFFTFIAIFMVSILVLAFTSDTYITFKNRIPVVKHRVQLANDYVRNIKSIYLKRALYATGYRALYALAMDINKSGYFASETEFKDNFKTAVLNATIRGSESDTLKGRTMIDTLNLLENMSWDAYHINTSFEKDIDKISLTVFQDNQTGPWKVGVNMSISYFVDAGLAEWNMSEVVQAVFSITGLDDPLYLVGTSGEFTNYINQTDFEVWGIENLRAHIINRTYKYDTEAPDFLTRFYGDTSNSECCGIESIVYPYVAGFDQGRSFVDCAYWGGVCGFGALYNISNFDDLYPSDTFRLDAYHTTVYNVTEYIEP